MTPTHDNNALAKAVTFLADSALRRHGISYGTFGPSHGDPGGGAYIKAACAALTHNMIAVTSVDHAKCDCGALAHNTKVRSCRDILLQNIIPTE